MCKGPVAQQFWVQLWESDMLAGLEQTMRDRGGGDWRGLKRQIQRDLKATWRCLCSTRPEEPNLVHDNARTDNRASPCVTCPGQERSRVRCHLTSAGET